MKLLLRNNKLNYSFFLTNLLNHDGLLLLCLLLYDTPVHIYTDDTDVQM